MICMVLYLLHDANKLLSQSFEVIDKINEEE